MAMLTYTQEENMDMKDIINIDVAKMRPATKEERDDINKYILSIAKDTGVNFY